MVAPPAPTPLPIDPILPTIVETLGTAGRAVLEAPPGAGKTTRVPLALMAASWRGAGRIVMLEPRRIAARAAAARMADSLGEPVGATVGYRTRLDTQIGDRTVIEVVTEGILTRRLQHDPSLDGIAAILFDEFHERSLQADLGLALTLDAADALRPDLKILIMSATLDSAPIAHLLEGAPIITSEGRAFPVETRYRPVRPNASVVPAMVATITEALAEEPGSILAFLPGQAEIHRTHAGLQDRRLPADVIVTPLFGDLNAAAQDRAIRPPPAGTRKVVLATAIAETSLTIDGVRVVIDSGLSRRPHFDPTKGMSGLITSRVTRANADQRRGRAGRTEPGICYRLWSEPEDRALSAHPPAEIAEADLAPLALELAAWGTDAGDLRWLTPPPGATLAQAHDLLLRLNALSHTGRITRHGQLMARFPMHPRLSHMVLSTAAADGPVAAATACVSAALLEERDILRSDGAGVDFTARLTAVQDRLSGKGQGAAGPINRVLAAARPLARRLKTHITAKTIAPQRAGSLLARAYPDRVAQARGSTGRFRLANGRGATIDPADQLASAPFVAVGQIGGAPGADATVYLAAPLSQAEVETLFADRIETVRQVLYDHKTRSVRAVIQRRVDRLVLDEQPDPEPDPEALTIALITASARLGLHTLTWSPAAQQLRARVCFAAHHRLGDGADSAWPDWSDPGLLRTLPHWLSPYATGMTKLEQLAEIDVTEALSAQLSWSQRQTLDRLVPATWTAPSGSRIGLDYTDPDKPVIAAKLQELFGQMVTPSVANGRVSLTVHLLSPAGRPLQVTQDLVGFWASGYAEVAKEMRGRYPRHPWPDDPTTATSTKRSKRRP